MDGWAKTKAAAKFAGVSERSFRDLLKAGLKHSRLPSGTILVRFSDIDKFLEGFTDDQNQVDKIVDLTIRELSNGTK